MVVVVRGLTYPVETGDARRLVGRIRVLRADTAEKTTHHEAVAQRLESAIATRTEFEPSPSEGRVLRNALAAWQRDARDATELQFPERIDALRQALDGPQDRDVR